MSRTGSVIVMAASAITASAIFAVITLANPPAGTPGTTYGILAVNNGNIGVSTTTPATKLDVNGSTTIRGWLDMTGNTIKNLAIPATSTDAVSKAYADAPGKLWGEGRPNVMVLNAGGTLVAGNASDAGECALGGMKISRGSIPVAWGDAAAGCPANWWVCSAAERDVNGGTAGYGSCGAQGQLTEWACSIGASGPDVGGFGIPVGWGYTNAWTADTEAATSTARGRMVTTAGVTGTGWSTCNHLSVWCCKQ